MIDIREGGLDHPDVAALIRLHLEQAEGSTPAENRHVMDADRLRTSGARFFTAWDGGQLLGMAALKQVEPGHGELKSMRTHPQALRRGVARAMLDHLLAEARAMGWTRLSLETGTAPIFAGANRLYEAAGFEDGPVFGTYPASPHNRFMTMVL